MSAASEAIAALCERLRSHADNAPEISRQSIDIDAAASLIRTQAERIEKLEGTAAALIEAHGDTKGWDFVGWCQVLAEKVESLSAALEGVRTATANPLDALKSCEAWLSQWAQHVGGCAGGARCSCGLTRIQFEARAALERT